MHSFIKNADSRSPEVKQYIVKLIEDHVCICHNSNLEKPKIELKKLEHGKKNRNQMKLHLR